MIPIPDVVDQKTCRTGPVADEDIDVTVVVDVTERGATAGLDDLKCPPRAPRYVVEAPTRIAEEQFALFQRKRIVRVITGRAIAIHIAIDRQQIQEPIVVEVQPGRAKAGKRKARAPHA